ncbi:MAG: T9SS type A sorting domain-containing protein, partial [Candidatus Latescibacteria bacterium]|nr:T9SS type A sorting domain-containing protein [Candidatus Latescibacterota bacterium]
IYREITVAEAETTIVDSVEVITPEAKEYIGWAEVRSYAPVGGATYIRALVATLGQTGAANYKVAAEVGGETSVTVNATLARKVSDGTVVATPAVGKMLASGDRLSSALSNAALVTATDNTAPAAITSFTAFDTPNDAGSTITVSWTLSEDDKVLSSMVYNEQLIATRGVEAYNIYRDGAFVGSAGYGVSSYQDAVDNGTYYEYEVRVTDSSNEVVSGLASAMAFAAASENASKGDWDADNYIGLADFSRFAGAYGNAAPAGTSDSIFDLDGSGTVDLGDFSIFASHYGETIGGAAKAVPVVFGKNTDVSLTMSAVEKAGLYTVQVNLNKTAEAKTYGYVMNYDVHAFEFDHAVVKSASTVPFLVQNTKPGELHIAHSIKGEAIVEVFFNVKDEFGGTVRISEARVWDQYHRANTVDLSAAAIKMLPTTFALKQNFPNPFNPTTVIGYALPEGSNVRLEIYNTLGQVVRTLVDGEQAGGVYRMTWDGRNEHGQEMATGVYIYRIVAGDFQATKRMLLIK